MVNWSVLIPIIVLVLGGGAWALWEVSKRNSYRYNFLLYSRDFRHVQVLKAKIISDPENTKVKLFKFRDSENTLMIREPKTSFNGKPARIITTDDNGDFTYITDTVLSSKGLLTTDSNGKPIESNGIDTSKYYLTGNLEPVERELLAYQLGKNKKRFNILDKTVFTTLIGLVMLAAIVMVGLIYGFVQLGNSLDNVQAINEQSRLIATSNSEVVNSLLTVTEYLVLVSGTEINGSIVRNLN